MWTRRHNTLRKYDGLARKAVAWLCRNTIYSPTFPYVPKDPHKLSSIVRKSGSDILHDPTFNKGTAFPTCERERLGLRGLLPPRVLGMDQQLQRFMAELIYGRNYIEASNVQGGDITEEDVRKWRSLQQLQDRNETLYYKVLLENFTDLAPIIYTPTVGWACINFHKLYRRPRGMVFSSEDEGQMAAIAWNWRANHVDAIVVTDGSRILGLGDLGVNGLGISIGKLDLYVAAAGFNPARTLPVVIDVGINNKQLRGDPLYLGLDQPRVTGDMYFRIMDEFVSAVTARWPHAMLQFEDFSIEHAEALLQRYRHCHLVFNDDIQGTACTAVAGLYGAMQVTGQPRYALGQQRIVVAGAGSAGMGVVHMIAKGMMNNGTPMSDAVQCFWVCDVKGLITTTRRGLTAQTEPFARRGIEDKEGEPLAEVIRRVKPTILIGLSGAGRIFTPEILTMMGQFNERPIIFPMSNPTSKMECTAEDAQRYTQGRAVFASGSPQPDVVVGTKRIASSQANNMYIFPGLAFGAHLGQSGTITDEMLMSAAEALPDLISEEDVRAGKVFPGLSHIRTISTRVARDVIKTAAEEGHLLNPRAMGALARGEEALEEFIEENQYKPVYRPLIQLPTGVLE